MARYKFLNINPLGKREEDCVCRAISLALDEDYYVIQKKLQLIGELFECEFLCECCYKHLLDSVYDLERNEEFKGLTINEFAESHESGTYIIRIDGHLTCLMDGIIYDLWNCTDKIVDIVWEVN